MPAAARVPEDRIEGRLAGFFSSAISSLPLPATTRASSRCGNAEAACEEGNEPGAGHSWRGGDHGAAAAAGGIVGDGDRIAADVGVRVGIDGGLRIEAGIGGGVGFGVGACVGGGGGEQNACRGPTASVRWERGHAERW